MIAKKGERIILEGRSLLKIRVFRGKTSEFKG